MILAVECSLILIRGMKVFESLISQIELTGEYLSSFSV